MNPKQLADFLQANNLLIQSRYSESISLYNSLLSSYQNYDLYLNRGIAYLNIKDYKSAENDINLSIIEDHDRFESYYHKGMVEFYQGRPSAALDSFEQAKKKGVDKKLIELWINKCKVEIKINGVEKEKIEVKERINAISNGKTPYIWFQTNKYIGFEFNIKLDKSENFKYSFAEDSGEISFPLSDGSEFKLILKFWHEILPNTSKVTHMLDKIELLIEKKNKNVNWAQLEKEIKVVGDIPNIQQAPSYPSSSKNKKDWSKLDKEIDEEMKEEKSSDPLNSLFKQIYGNADENTRRAMIKSFQTSNGTVLSTNWDEVSKKDYEGKDRPEAPQGQQWADKNK